MPAYSEVEIPRLFETPAGGAIKKQSRRRPTLLRCSLKFFFLEVAFGALAKNSVCHFFGQGHQIHVGLGRDMTLRQRLNCCGVCLCLQSGLFQPRLPAAVSWVSWGCVCGLNADSRFHLCCGHFIERAPRAIGLGHSSKLIIECVDRRIHIDL